MKAVVANYTTLTAMPDSVTLSHTIVLESGSFTQVFDTTTGTPNNPWNETTGPKFYIRTRDTTGTEYTTTQSNFVLVYNNTEISIANDFGTDGYLKASKAGIPARGLKMTVDNDGVHHFQFVKDVFSASNANNDTFYMKFDVVADDTTMHVQTGEQPVQIIPVSKQGNTYYVVCASKNVTSKADGEVSCKLFSTQDANSPIDLTQSSKWSLQWYKVVGTTSTAVTGGTSAALAVKASDVNGLALYRVDITDKTSNKVYSGYANVQDESDPFRLGFIETSKADDGFTVTHTPKMVQKHETVTLQGVVTDGDGTIKTNSGVTVKMTVMNKDAKPIDDLYNSDKTAIVVSHAKIMDSKIGGQLSIYLTGSTN